MKRLRLSQSGILFVEVYFLYLVFLDNYILLQKYSIILYNKQLVFISIGQTKFTTIQNIGAYSYNNRSTII